MLNKYFIIQFVEIKQNSADVKESFIYFIPLEMKTVGGGITEIITNKLKREKILMIVDNQATMAGIPSLEF